jgi:Leucine-rich repeat (LRR) protein
LPDSISNLRALETLDVYNNQLRNLPAGLEKLSKLKRIYVLNCGLSKEALEKSLNGVELNTDVPPEAICS